MRPGVLLQGRDMDLLRALYENAVMSFEQVCRKLFAGVNAQTASNRLTKLYRAGFIRKHRVGIVVYKAQPKFINIVFTIGTAGLSVLKTKWPGLVTKDTPPVLNTMSLVHDLELVELMDKLRSKTGKVVMSTRALLVEAKAQLQVPDAVALGAESEEKMAIELEMTAKSDRRYREILTNYRLDPQYKKVIFFAADKQIRQKLLQALGVPHVKEGVAHVEQGKFEVQEVAA